jgi:NAD(P)-dependent dehydrogenase (short-subunit alcohol dehydrogenase family)
MSLQGKTVAVTGGNGNLGRAVARAALDAGASVALLDVAFSADIASALPGKMTTYTVNLLDAADTRDCFERIGRVDALCNLAGGFSMGDPVHATSDDVWTRMLDLNTRTLIHAVRAAVPRMLAQRGGKIVNVGATAALAGGANMGAYAASKSIVIRLTESMSAELKRQGINVNCVLPSIIDTPPNRKDMPNVDPKTWVAPADLAAVILFLISDASRAVHGAAIPVVNLV